MPFQEWPRPLAWLAVLLAVPIVLDALRRSDLRGAREGWHGKRIEHPGPLAWLLASLVVLAGRQMIVTTPDQLRGSSVLVASRSGFCAQLSCPCPPRLPAAATSTASLSTAA